MMKLLLLLVLNSASALATPTGDATITREAAVRAHGAEVMPFSVAGTLHVFEKTATGGTQRVIARSGNDIQIPMIHQHLHAIAEQFAARDFSGPAQIHGEGMPGLAALRAASAAELHIEYRKLEQGAEIQYRGNSEKIRNAIHQWFDAQLADHGSDATGHHHHN